jgi:hypothetical protein
MGVSRIELTVPDAIGQPEMNRSRCEYGLLGWSSDIFGRIRQVATTHTGDLCLFPVYGDAV